MGYCNRTEYLEFMRQAPELEQMLVRSGIHLVKFWFSVSRCRFLSILSFVGSLTWA
jgi:polyphosphate kinase